MKNVLEPRARLASLENLDRQYVNYRTIVYSQLGLI